MISRSHLLEVRINQKRMFKKLPHSNKSRLILGLIALDGVFFTFTDPSNMNTAVIFVGFLLLSVTLYLLINRVCAFGRFYGFQLDARSHRISLFGTGTVVSLIALQSIGALTFRDILVAIPLTVIAYTYLSYGRNARHLSRPNLS